MSHATPTPTSKSKGQKSRSAGAGAYCGGHLAAQLVFVELQTKKYFNNIHNNHIKLIPFTSIFYAPDSRKGTISVAFVCPSISPSVRLSVRRVHSE